MAKLFSGLRMYLTTLLLLSVAHSAVAASDWRVHSELALGYDDNVASIRQGAPHKEAGFVLAGIGAERFFSLGAAQGLETRLNLEGQAVPNFDQLNNLKTGLRIRYLLRPGKGFFAPLFALSGNAAWWEFSSRSRDSAEYRASASVTNPITTRLSTRLSTSATWRYAKSRAFDLDTQSLGLDLDWKPARNLTIYTGYQMRLGNFTSSTANVGRAATIATAIEPDEAFPGEMAVRQNAQAHIGTVGFNLALSPRWAVDVQGLFVEAETEIEVRYQRLQTFFSLLGRF